MVIDTLDADDQPRLTLQAGDFFVDALPSADAYILMEVLHDWPDKLRQSLDGRADGAA